MEQHLERCLNSIVDQNYKNLEIILINDGSSDSSGAICDKYAKDDNRFKVIHQSNAGVSAARNAGLERASGDYLSFIDPDDWIDPGMYETLSGHINKQQPDIIRFNAYRKGEIVNQLPFNGLYKGKRLENEIMLPLIGSPTFGGMFILGVLWMHLYKRDIIEKYKIRFHTGLRRCEDRLFTLTCVLHAGNMLFIDYAPYYYEVYETSLSNKYDPRRWEQEIIYLESLKNEYTSCKENAFTKEADKRVESEYLLRAITSVNNEFFSNSNLGFIQKYINTKKFITNPKVVSAIKNTPKEKASLKGKLTLTMIKYKLPLFLSIFNTAIVYKNKISRRWTK